MPLYADGTDRSTASGLTALQPDLAQANAVHSPCPTPTPIATILPPVALTLMVGAVTGDVGTTCGLLSIFAIAVAAREHRHLAMLTAAGIAIGLASYALMLLPVVVAIAIQSRVRWGDVAVLPIAVGVVWIVVPDARSIETASTLWTLSQAFPDHVPRLEAFWGATAIGVSAWFAAIYSVRRLTARQISKTMLLSVLTLTLLTPAPIEAVFATLVLALASRDARSVFLISVALLVPPSIGLFFLLIAAAFIAVDAIPRAANDNTAPAFA